MADDAAEGTAGRGRLHARIEEIERTRGEAPWSEKPTGERPSIRLAITPPGGFHRHDRSSGQGPGGA